MSGRGSFGSYCRSTDTENQEVQKRQRGQAAAHGLHRRAAAAAQERVPGEPLHHGAAAPGPGPGAAPQRVPDQDLVPEQTRKDQEGQRLQERPGAAADGAGTVQPLHHHRPGGQGRQRLTAPPAHRPRTLHCKYIQCHSKRDRSSSSSAPQLSRTDTENQRFYPETEPLPPVRLLDGQEHSGLFSGPTGLEDSTEPFSRVYSAKNTPQCHLNKVILYKIKQTNKQTNIRSERNTGHVFKD